MFRAWSRASATVKCGLVAAWCVVCSVFAADSLLQFLTILAFFMGAGGMGIMFFRWRLHGDRLARVLCLVAFGAWGISVIMGSVASDNHLSVEPAFWIAGVALLIGFVGGPATLLRTYERLIAAFDNGPAGSRWSSFALAVIAEGHAVANRLEDVGRQFLHEGHRLWDDGADEKAFTSLRVEIWNFLENKNGNSTTINDAENRALRTLLAALKKRRVRRRNRCDRLGRFHSAISPVTQKFIQDIR